VAKGGKARRAALAAARGPAGRTSRHLRPRPRRIPSPPPPPPRRSLLARKRRRRTRKKKRSPPRPPAEKDAVATKRGPRQLQQRDGPSPRLASTSARGSSNTAPSSSVRCAPTSSPALPHGRSGFSSIPPPRRTFRSPRTSASWPAASDSLVFESKTSDGTQSSKGKWTRYAVGVRGRIPTGPGANSPLVGLEATYGAWKYSFSGTDFVVNDSARLGCRLQVQSARPPTRAFPVRAPAAIFLGAGYMNIMSSGPFGDKFPARHLGWRRRQGRSQLRTRAVDRGACVVHVRAHLLDREIAARGRFSSRGGALDQYFIGNVGLLRHFLGDHDHEQTRFLGFPFHWALLSSSALSDAQASSRPRSKKIFAPRTPAVSMARQVRVGRRVQAGAPGAGGTAMPLPVEMCVTTSLKTCQNSWSLSRPAPRLRPD